MWLVALTVFQSLERTHLLPTSAVAALAFCVLGLPTTLTTQSVVLLSEAWFL